MRLLCVCRVCDCSDGRSSCDVFLHAVPLRVRRRARGSGRSAAPPKAIDPFPPVCFPLSGYFDNGYYDLIWRFNSSQALRVPSMCLAVPALLR